MPDENPERRTSRISRTSRKVLAREREMLVAQMLLLLCDAIDFAEPSLERDRLYNEIKPIAEGVLRNGS